jgi:hypothetical protein
VQFKHNRATGQRSFLARRKHRTTISDEAVERSTAAHKKAGVFYGQW